MFNFSPLEQFDVIQVLNLHHSFYDVSFVNILLPLVFVVLLVRTLLGLLIWDFKLIPDY